MARRRGRGKKDESFLAVLLASPWQVSAGVGVAVFVALKWILPAMAGGNMFLKPISAAASSVAWLFALAFFLVGAVVFAKEKSAKGKLRLVEPSLHNGAVHRPASQEPSWAKYAGR